MHRVVAREREVRKAAKQAEKEAKRQRIAEELEERRLARLDEEKRKLQERLLQKTITRICCDKFLDYGTSSQSLKRIALDVRNAVNKIAEASPLGKDDKLYRKGRHFDADAVEFVLAHNGKSRTKLTKRRDSVIKTAKLLKVAAEPKPPLTPVISGILISGTGTFFLGFTKICLRSLGFGIFRFLTFTGTCNFRNCILGRCTGFASKFCSSF